MNAAESLAAGLDAADAMLREMVDEDDYAALPWRTEGQEANEVIDASDHTVAYCGSISVSPLIVAAVNALPAALAQDRALLKRHYAVEQRWADGLWRLGCPGCQSRWPCLELIAAAARWASFTPVVKP